MEAEVVRRRRLGHPHGHCSLPLVAHQATDRRVVLEYGHVGSDRVILRHVRLPTDTLLRYGVRRPAWFVVVSQLV